MPECNFLHHWNSHQKMKLIWAEHTKLDYNFWIKAEQLTPTDKLTIKHQLTPAWNFLLKEIMPWATRVKSNLRKEQLMLLATHARHLKLTAPLTHAPRNIISLQQVLLELLQLTPKDKINQGRAYETGLQFFGLRQSNSHQEMNSP